jgi:hypothetical protein
MQETEPAPALPSFEESDCGTGLIRAGVGPQHVTIRRADRPALHPWSPGYLGAGAVSLATRGKQLLRREWRVGDAVAKHPPVDADPRHPLVPEALARRRPVIAPKPSSRAQRRTSGEFATSLLLLEREGDGPCTG